MTEKKKSTGIKSWPVDDRPREKLLKKGAKCLREGNYKDEHTIYNKSG